MKLIIHHKKNTHFGLGGFYHEAAGLLFKDLSTVYKYLTENNGSYYFNFSEPMDLKILKKMVDKFPPGATLRFGSTGMLPNVINFYRYNLPMETRRQKELMQILYESLYIYWLIRKSCKPLIV